MIGPHLVRAGFFDTLCSIEMHVMTRLSRIFSRCAAVLIVSAGIVPGLGASESLEFIGDQHTAFADTYQHSTVMHEFVVRNDAKHPITIVEGIAVSGTGAVTFDPAPIPPGATVRIQANQPVGASLGATALRFAIVTDEPGRPKYRFSLSGFVQSPYDPETAHIDLGFIDRRENSSATFELHSREVEQLRLTTATTEHQNIDVVAEPAGLTSEGIEVRVLASPGLPRGILSGTATLTTNVTSAPRFDFSYTANVFDDVVPAENPVAFGLIRSGQEAIKDIVVQSRSGAPFVIDHATDTIGEILGVSWKPCDGRDRGPSPCFQVRFSLSPEEERMTAGTADLHVVGDPEPVPILVTSWVVSPDTVVKQLRSPTAQPDKRDAP